MGQTQNAHDYLFWKYGAKTAIRQGKWKALRLKPDAPIELYDLVLDLGEDNDIAADRPEIVARLEKLMEEAQRKE